MKKFAIALLFLTLLYSTTITGKIYDADKMTPLMNSLVTIENSDGNILVQKICGNEYSIEIAPGKYLVRAYHYQNGTLDEYNEYDIEASGNEMKLDLLLIPYELFQMTPDFSKPKYADSGNAVDAASIRIDYGTIIVGTILVAGLIGIYLRYFGKGRGKHANSKAEEKNAGVTQPVAQGPQAEEQEEPHELDEECKKIMKIITENEGRITQKELRQILGFSETKMSFIITELEALGCLKRIKKGRENILKVIK